MTARPTIVVTYHVDYRDALGGRHSDEFKTRREADDRFRELRASRDIYPAATLWERTELAIRQAGEQ